MEPSQWLDEINPHIIKSQASIDKLCGATAAGLTFSCMQEALHDPYYSSLDLNIRSTIVLSQAVSSSPYRYPDQCPEYASTLTSVRGMQLSQPVSGDAKMAY